MRGKSVRGFIVDLHLREIYPGALLIEGSKISKIIRLSASEVPDCFILIGFVDAHVHVESSLAGPQAFAWLAVPHGTVGTVSDPHEIANVLGLPGVLLMIAESKKVPLKIAFGAPTCVPATNPDIETSGAVLTAGDVTWLLELPDIYYASEVMNFPAVINDDPKFKQIIAAAQKLGKPVDGHFPGGHGETLKKYVEAGIQTDHESVTLEEALEKISLGMKILIREGSAAKNFEALHPLFQSHPKSLMFCTDDAHAHNLAKGHINKLVARAVGLGYDLFDVLEAASLRPIEHYKLPIGTLKQGDAADFIIVKDLTDFQVLETWIDGGCVAKDGKALFEITPPPRENVWKLGSLSPAQFEFRLPEGDTRNEVEVRAIEIINGELITREQFVRLLVQDGIVQTSQEQDVVRIAVVNRYAANSEPALGFLIGTGMYDFAMASSVAHDCHNLVVAGSNQKLMAKAANMVSEAGGGICFVTSDEVFFLPLPLAGLMSDLPPEEIVARYEAIHRATVKAGCKLYDVLMMLSFLALSVIGDAKMTDKGMFHTPTFRHIPVLVD